jgi:hypothetical protein
MLEVNHNSQAQLVLQLINLPTLKYSKRNTSDPIQKYSYCVQSNDFLGPEIYYTLAFLSSPILCLLSKNSNF